MISLLDYRVLDANSEFIGISADELMNNAGRELANIILDIYGRKKILFVCGSGNNGGDGFTAAKILDADVAYFKYPRTKQAKRKFRELKRKPIVYTSKILDNYDVVVDCVLGTGISGDIKQPYKDYINFVNESKKVVVACDVPSGFGSSGPVIKADTTITFHDIKEGMNEENCGNIIVVDIGIPDKVSEIVGRGDMLRYPIPKNDSYKGQNGRLVIIGGGPYIGAPAFAGMAALRAGIDLVHIITPETIKDIIASYSPSLVVHGLPGDHLTIEHVDSIMNMCQIADAILIGPGLGTSEDTVKSIREIVKRCNLPMVIDADGINAIVGHIPTGKKILLTPHSNEFYRLAGDKKPSIAALKLGCTIVLKGHVDTITDGKKIRKNITGTSAMTVGGTGDVLAGIISGLISKGMDLFNAGCLGAYICGRAGEKSFDKFSYGLTATDIIEDIARILQEEL